MKKILLGLLFTVLVVGIVGCGSNNVEELTGFSYSSGSTSHVFKFYGNRNDEIINIDFSEFDSGDYNEKNLKISFNDFKNLLNNTKVENCKKHTYDYQCGENDGCSSSSFKVNFENEKSSCYEINTYVVDFFEDLLQEK